VNRLLANSHIGAFCTTGLTSNLPFAESRLLLIDQAGKGENRPDLPFPLNELKW
jgi:hypothetical protein